MNQKQTHSSDHLPFPLVSRIARPVPRQPTLIGLAPVRVPAEERFDLAEASHQPFLGRYRGLEHRESVALGLAMNELRHLSARWARR